MSLIFIRADNSAPNQSEINESCLSHDVKCKAEVKRLFLILELTLTQKHGAAHPTYRDGARYRERYRDVFLWL